MPFLNIPLKTLKAELIDIVGTETMPWYEPTAFPVPPGAPMPEPVPKEYRWRARFNISEQQQSSYLTRSPGVYTGMDVTVGQWVANTSSGQSWQIINIESKSDTEVIAILQDIYRYNTFRDPFKLGNGAPSYGTYIVFNVSETGNPQIDPIPDSGVSEVFTQNLQSRFEYINLQYDYPLYQENNTFGLNDVIAVNSVENKFVLADAENKIVIGRVTSVSDTIPGWFTINPVQKVVDFLNYLPGDVGDIIYSSTTEPGGITTTPGGAQLYIKLRNNTSSVTYSTEPGPTLAGNAFQINGIDAIITGSGTMDDLVSAANLITEQTGVEAEKILLPSSVETNVSSLSPIYGEIVLFAANNPARASINGVEVVFNLLSTDPGYEDYSRAPEMARVINQASIPDIVASVPDPQKLIITNTAGGSITIVNLQNDINGVPFAGLESASGIALLTPASTNYEVKFTAIDARPIDFLDVTGSTVADFGLISVENGTKACGLYIEEGLRQASSTVVSNLVQLATLEGLVGDQAYVIDSDDGNGNHVGEWSMWLYDGTKWVQTSNQDSATTDAKSLEYTLSYTDDPTIEVGTMSTGRRITLITVEVTDAFAPDSSLTIGYQINSINPVPPVLNGLMNSGLIDLSVPGTYTTQTDLLFGTDTEQGDVTILATFSAGSSVSGSAQIIVSYV